MNKWHDVVALVIGLLAFLLFVPSTQADDTLVISDQSALLPLDYRADQTEVFRQVINEQSEMVIEGENRDTEPRIVILRFDDISSSGYGSRLNIERVVTPGPFTIQLPLYGLKTPSGRIFDWQSWQRFILFDDNEQKDILVNRISISRAANYSSESFGFDLGTANSPVLTGMTQITEAYPGIRGQHMSDRHFASGNAMTSDGIEGIESLTLLVPNGHYDVTLWFTMEGQWENLPRQLNQQIKLQGQSVYDRQLTAQQWLSQHYFMGQNKEAWIDGSPWQLFGDQDYQRVTAEAQVNDGKLYIDMAGATTHDNYLAGVFVSPTRLNGSDSELLQQALQTRFEQKWQVVNKPKSNRSSKERKLTLEQVYFNARWQQDKAEITRSESVVASKGGIAVLDFAIASNYALDDVTLSLTLTNASGVDVSQSVQIRQGMWRYQRPQGSSTLLLLSADELRSVANGGLIKLNDTLSRRINLYWPISNKTASSVHSGQLKLVSDGQVIAKTDFSIEVLDVVRPKVRQSVGIYHERSPHWNWFDALAVNSNYTLKCDYQFLEQLGLKALSPPLTTPRPITMDSTTDQINESLIPYLSDLNRYHNYFDRPALDYTTIKRFESYYHNKPELKQRHLSALAQAINVQQLPIPQFAIADEVEAMNSTELSHFSAQIGQLQNAMPEASFLGQLNKPKNVQLTPLMDTMVINYGYGVSQQIINSLQRQGKSVWLYNMQRKRLAAGFYLWQSRAEGYVQWHGRMPTGQPFNPVDGREADFQMLYPSVNGCQLAPDINADLLAIAQGLEDRRWINWLIKNARNNPKAKSLVSKLRQEIPTTWEDVMNLDEQQVHLWRKAITDLAIQSKK